MPDHVSLNFSDQLICHFMSFRSLRSFHVYSCNYTSFMSFHVLSCHIMSYHVISCNIMSYHVVSCYIMSYHIMSYHVILRLFMSFHVSLDFSDHLSIKSGEGGCERGSKSLPRRLETASLSGRRQQIRHTKHLKYFISNLLWLIVILVWILCLSIINLLQTESVLFKISGQLSKLIDQQICCKNVMVETHIRCWTQNQTCVDNHPMIPSTHCIQRFYLRFGLSITPIKQACQKISGKNSWKLNCKAPCAENCTQHCLTICTQNRTWDH
jgi:hypothetical protein